MQVLDSNLLTAMKRGSQLDGKPLCVAEWNFNYTFPTTVVNELDVNNTAWAYTKDYFPPGSVVKGVRPSSGIFYPSLDEAGLTPSVSGLGTKRFYPLSKNNSYQYWESPELSTESATDGESNGPIVNPQYGLSKSRLRVNYNGSPKVNKIRVTFNLGPMPADWVISIQDAATDVWSDITGPYTIDSITGKCELWWNGTAWTSTQVLDASLYKRIKAVKVWIKTIFEPGKRVKIVEIAACREIDMTDRMMGFSLNSSMDNEDFIHPVGEMNANDGSVQIDNSDLELNDIDIDSDFYGLLNGWSQWRFYVDFNLTRYGGSSSVKVRVGTMYTNNWSQTDQSKYDVELFDIIKLLQSVKCPLMLEENTTIAKIISSMLDSIGIDSYNFEPEDFDSSHQIRYFWTDGTETVYEAINKLCSSYQTAVFSDEFGMIRLLTREDIIDADDDIVWEFLGAQDGLDVPDVISLRKKSETVINDVNIKYKRRRAKVDDTDVLSKQLTTEVWSTTDTVLLRSSGLQLDIPESGLIITFPGTGGTDNASIRVTQKEAESWPYAGFANIDGEVFEYKGKGYAIWNYVTQTYKNAEVLIYSPEDKLKWDKIAFDRYIAAGASTIMPNFFTGRLFTIKRNVDGKGERYHTPDVSPGWFGMNGWTLGARNLDFWPGKYFEPGRTSFYNEEDLQDYRTRLHWTMSQQKWYWNGSILTCDNVADGAADIYLIASYLKNLGDTEYREFGTRLKLAAGTPFAKAGILFNLSDAVGYDNTNFLDNAMQANRFYIVSIASTDSINSIGRPNHEIIVEAKNGDNIIMLKSMHTDPSQTAGPGHKWQIDREKWYDLDVVFRDGSPNQTTHEPNSVMIDIYIDGQLVDSFYGEDAIRPTGWAGLHARQSTKASFDYFYASTTTDLGRPTYSDDETFDCGIIQLPTATNGTFAVNLPTDGGLEGNGMMSICAPVDVQIHALKFIGGKTGPDGKVVAPIRNEVGPITLKAFNRTIFNLNEVQREDCSMIRIRYTSTADVSVCFEYSQAINYPYNPPSQYVPPARSFYDKAKGGYVSSKAEQLILEQRNYDFWAFYMEPTIIIPPQLFYDDFGAQAREIRTFDVEYDVAPAKGVRLYLSNQKIRILDENYGPSRGNFTLVNSGVRDEILNGTEQIDETNSIDHTMFVYGHVLEDRGDQIKNVQNIDSIKKYGIVTMDINSEWIFTDDQAQNLGSWIADNWGEPMDTLELEVFTNTFSQIGDKVNIKYPDTSIDDSWTYIITQISRDFDEGGFASRITVRRVR